MNWTIGGNRMSNHQVSEVKVQEFKDILNEKTIRAQIKNSLKENSGAFMSSMIDLYNNDNYLNKCDPRAVIMECLKAASLKLPLVKTLGFAYVVPYGNKPTFTIGYKGLIQLAQRTGLYKIINADVVYEGELKGLDKLKGTMDFSGQKVSDKAIGYFGYIETVYGFEKTLYMSKEEIEEWGKKYSKTFNNGPWKTEFDKMAMKTVLRKLISIYGPMTVDADIAVGLSIENDTDMPETNKEEKSENRSSLFETDGDVLEGEYVEIPQ